MAEIIFRGQVDGRKVYVAQVASTRINLTDNEIAFLMPQASSKCNPVDCPAYNVGRCKGLTDIAREDGALLHGIQKRPVEVGGLCAIFGETFGVTV
ncbi:MAG TPA: hypothetical protein VKC54_04400 [Patescibacteria group bacterium]|nr:hypothetical protein [Patescibacteria group bacterium]